jgi:F-type H+-transporting ATPase subunit b
LRKSTLRISVQILGLAGLVIVAAALAGAPAHIAAQQPSTPAASAAAPASPEAPKSEEEQERAFLHAAPIQSIAKILHLSVDTTSDLFVGINFAIIVLAIVIPLTRIMPKVIRQRSVTLNENIKTAREATEDAKSRLTAVEEKLAGLGQEIEKFKAQVEQEALEDQKRIKAALEEESARIVASAEQEIGAAAAQARRGLRYFAAELAIEQASKQLVLTPETDQALIAEFVAQASGDAAASAGKGGKN